MQPVNKFSIKGDHVFNPKHRISGYYGYDRESIVPGPRRSAAHCRVCTANYNDLQQKSDVFRMSWDWTISPTKLNHFYAGGNNWRQDHKPPQEYIGNWKRQILPGQRAGLQRQPGAAEFERLRIVGRTGRQRFGKHHIRVQRRLHLDQGSHTIKFGGQYQLTHYNGFGRQCISGLRTLQLHRDGRPGVTDPECRAATPSPRSCLGYADSGQIDTIRFIGQQFPYFAGFAQDDWRVSRKLVVNLGLRWETSLPPTGLEDRWTDFSPTTPNPAAGGRPGAVLFAGFRNRAAWAHGLWPTPTLARSDRISGWPTRIDEKTVIRASYARSFAELMAVTGSAHTMGFTLTQTFPNSN